MPPKTSFAKLLTRYLEDAGISQDTLSRLTVRLAEQDPRVTKIAQQQISRWAIDEIPTPENVNRLAIVLAAAMREAGFDEIDDRDIYKHLLNARRDKVVAREVSRFAANIDAIIAPLPLRLRTIAERTLEAAAQAFVTAFVADQEQARRHNTQQRQSENQE